MAYIVMAYTVMARHLFLSKQSSHIVMAYVVMAYVVMVRHLFLSKQSSHIVMAYYSYGLHSYGQAPVPVEAIKPYSYGLI